ncbi:MAG: SGNH/GDSL hydrolase family protein [Bacteroidales bacterium]|nr:SGNH/GDSL hydrolase family protein [Bacteroidales bacterium]
MRKELFAFTLLFVLVATTASGQDWANLNRFAKENDSLKSTPAVEDRVVMMGNSITEGWSKFNPAFFAKHPNMVNRGISGQTTPQMLLRFRADVIALHPKAVVILAGINDIAGNTGPSTLEMIEDNISSMVDLATSNGVKVVLSSVLPAYDFYWNLGQRPADKVVALNKWIKSYAQLRGCSYVDYFTPMADERKGLKKEYSEDGVHPNLKGYELMDPLLEAALANILP